MGLLRGEHGRPRIVDEEAEFNINVGLQSFFGLAFLASSFFGEAPKFSLKSS